MTSIYRYQICFSFLFFTKKYRKLIIISCLSDAVNWLLHIVEVGCNICDFVVNPNFVLLAEFSTKLRCSIAFSCRKKTLFISKTLALTNALQEYQYRVSTISSTNEQWNQGIFYLKIFKFDNQKYSKSNSFKSVDSKSKSVENQFLCWICLVKDSTCVMKYLWCWWARNKHSLPEISVCLSVGDSKWSPWFSPGILCLVAGVADRCLKSVNAKPGELQICHNHSKFQL